MKRLELFIPSSSEIHPERSGFIEGYVNSGVATLETYTYFEGDKRQRAAAHTAFLAGEVRNPTLNYCPKMNVQRIERRDQFNAVTVLAQAMASAHELTVRDHAVLDLLTRRSQELAYLEATWHLSVLTVDDPQREEYASLVKEMGRELFGEPERSEFIALNNELRAQASRLFSDNSASDVTKIMSSEILELSGDTESLDVHEHFTPQQETINWYRQKLKEHFDPIFETIFADVPDDKQFAPEEMVEYFNKAIILLGYRQWRCEINPNGTAVEARQSERKLFVGAGREIADLATMKRLIIHEIGVHIARRSNGDKLDDGLLGLGLSGYGAFEEGFAVALEEAYEGAYKRRGTQYTFALGMAMGMDGGNERDFRDTFELQWRRIALESVEDGQLTDEAMTKARKRAYTQCVRIWRGMPTDIEGCVYPKDKAYSNTGVWQYLEEYVGDDTILEYLSQGKVNPLIPQHVKVVASYKR